MVLLGDACYVHTLLMKCHRLLCVVYAFDAWCLIVRLHYIFESLFILDTHTLARSQSPRILTQCVSTRLYPSNRFTFPIYSYHPSQQPISPKIHFNIHIWEHFTESVSATSVSYASILAFYIAFRLLLLLPSQYTILLYIFSYFAVRRCFVCCYCWLGCLAQDSKILSRAVSRHFGMRLAIYNELYS